jgi:hypothetical protein
MSDISKLLQKTVNKKKDVKKEDKKPQDKKTKR